MKPPRKPKLDVNQHVKRIFDGEMIERSVAKALGIAARELLRPFR